MPCGLARENTATREELGSSTLPTRFPASPFPQPTPPTSHPVFRTRPFRPPPSPRYGARNRPFGVKIPAATSVSTRSARVIRSNRRFAASHAAINSLLDS